MLVNVDRYFFFYYYLFYIVQVRTYHCFDSSMTRSLSHILNTRSHIVIYYPFRSPTNLKISLNSTSAACRFILSLLSPKYILASFLCCTMAESSSDNPEMTSAMQAVAQNLLSPAFQ